MVLSRLPLRMVVGMVVLGLLLLASQGFAAAAIDIDNPGNGLNPCQKRCFQYALSVTDCTSSDAQCLCTNQNYITALSACIVVNCDLADAYEMSYVSGNLCHAPRDNHYAELLATNIVCIVVAYVTIILRVISRVFTSQKFWWDDWWHLIAAGLTTPLAILGLMCTINGMGYHIYDVDISVDKLRTIIIWYYICQIFWAVVMYSIKMSILFLYLRIFPDRIFRRYVIAIMALVSISIVILEPLVIWQCNPVEVVWNLRRKDAFCVEISAVAYSNVVVNIVTEVAIIVLPLPLLSKLRITWQTKLGLIVLFCCGAVVIAIAAARIPSLKHVEAINDPTYSNNQVIYWSCAETSVAHVCAATLAIRPLYLKIKQACLNGNRDSANSSGLGFSSGSKFRAGSEEPINNGKNSPGRPRVASDEITTTNSLALSGAS